MTQDELNKIEGLTDEQKTAILELANTEHNTLTGQIYGNFDNDMKSLGYEKPQGVKTYDFIKSTVQTLTDKVKTLEGDKAALQEQLDAKGGSDQTIANLRKANGDLQHQLDAERESRKNDKAQAAKELRDYKVTTALQNALVGVKFKANIPESIRNLAVKEATAKLASGTVDFDTDGNICFRDANGEIRLNAKNGNKPYTAQELLLESDELKEIVDFGRKKQGGGTEPSPTSLPNSIGVDMDGVKTQVEANDRIKKHLLDEGVSMSSPEYMEKFAKLQEELGVSKLPIGIF